MDAIRRLEIIEKLNDKSRVSENGQCIMWTGCCKGRRVRYGVMCINVSLHGSVSKCVSVHRLALLNAPTNLSLQDVLNLQGDASHLCHNTLCINSTHISLELHWLNNSRQHELGAELGCLHCSANMDAIQRIGIIDKLNDKCRLSENGECIMWTGSCKGQSMEWCVLTFLWMAACVSPCMCTN